MAKTQKQRLKILYILKFLQAYSDPLHPLETQRLIALLEKEEIAAERKSIYSDIALLKEYGYPIGCSKQRGNSGFYLEEREFELAELKLLVDAVQSSRFMTAKKSEKLIKKLEKLASPFEEKQLKRQVYISDRVKTENESIYQTVDVIHAAMRENKTIVFRYYEWGIDKQMHFRKNGSMYEVSPYYLIWKDENYYLIAYDKEADCLKHYRVDKMTDLLAGKKERMGGELAATVNPAHYAKQVFGMFAGEEEIVTIQFPKHLSGVIFDRFGKEVFLRKREEGLYSARVRVAISPHFFGWLTGISQNKQVRLLGPERVVKEYEQYLSDIVGRYVCQD